MANGDLKEIVRHPNGVMYALLAAVLSMLGTVYVTVKLVEAKVEDIFTRDRPAIVKNQENIAVLDERLKRIEDKVDRIYDEVVRDGTKKSD